MAIPCHIDHTNRLIVSYVPAHARPDEIVNLIDNTADDDALNAFNVLTIFEDLNRVVGDLNAFQNSLKSISEILVNHYGTSGDYQAAYVVSKRVDFGLLRMFTTYRGYKPEHTGLFYEMAAALDWLGVSEANLPDLLANIEALTRSAANPG